MTEHTPGPWMLDDGLVYVPLAAPDRHGATIYAIATIEESNEANARLIAAAPAMLAALEGLTATARTFRNVPAEDQEWTSIDDEALDAAFAAIAAARKQEAHL